MWGVRSACMGRTTDIQQARALIERGHSDAAAKILRKLVTADANDAVAHADLAQALWRLNKPAQAVPFAQRAVDLIPNAPPFHILLGHCLCLARRFEEGVAHLARGVELDPANPQPHVLLIEALATQYRWDEVASAAQAAMERFPTEHTFYLFLAHALSQSGHVEASAAVLARGAARFPLDLTIAMARAVHANYREGIARDEQLALHRAAGGLIAAHAGDPLPLPASDPNPERALRVGVVSPDLRGHSVLFFADALLRALDARAFKVQVFSTNLYPDEMSMRLRNDLARAGVPWHEAARLTSRDLALLVRKQKIDVLVELSGPTMNHRLTVCALRAAPVQVTAIGYPGTTGVPHVHVRLVDSLTDPPGEEPWHTERLVRLDPCFLCYTPLLEAPAVSPLPARERGHVTFGSFNAPTKFTDHALRLWGRVLAAAPGSRLLLKIPGTERPHVRAMVERRLGALGLDLGRVEILARTDGQADHLAQYARMDIALDTFPYHGTTTTCEALYMGVPVVTRIGDRHASRVGLRASLLASPLCDARAYGRRVGDALRGLWREWCARQRAPR